MFSQQHGIVFVGAGQAAVSGAVKLRSIGYTGAITIIGDEAALPYRRPPLSKQYLLGEVGMDQIVLRSEKFYQDHDITCIRGNAVTAIDRTRKRVQLGDGWLPYAQLALTTGARPRLLPALAGGQRPGIHTIRTVSDVDDIQPLFKPGARLLIVGGGFIGLEAASVARRLGVDVLIVESGERILQRAVGPLTSTVIREMHIANGVTLRENVQLISLKNTGGSKRAELSDGTSVDVDFIIIGIGSQPNTDLAEKAGIPCQNGIIVDEFGRTCDPSIWAAGDCATFPWQGQLIRIESVGNAVDHGECVAINMAGGTVPYEPKPWFWSDQFDSKLQIAGVRNVTDRVVRRNGNGNAMSFWYYNSDTLTCVEAFNDARSYMIAKRLLDSGKTIPSHLAADHHMDLKTLLTMARPAIQS